MNQKRQVREHLDHDYDAAVRDPLWGHIYLSRPLEKICATREFRQLAKIKQLGPTHIVYPGAVHTRLNHSLGVFHLARRLVQRLIGFPDAPELTVEGVKAYLAAALLHDLGHFPFTHSLKELPLQEHEQLTAAILQEGEIAELLRNVVHTDPAMVASIVDESLPTDGCDEVRLYRKLLSGTLDPDKLDYLNRDAYYCGVPYGVQDVDFVLDRVRPNGYDGIALDHGGVSAVENILFSKYLMYRAVYWHKSVRVATAMIKKALHTALDEGLVVPEELYGLDDESFTTTFSTKRHPAFELIERVDRGALYAVALELPFRPELPGHQGLLRLGPRRVCEALCLQALSGATVRDGAEHALLIDVPEAVNFEVAFPIQQQGITNDYLQSGTVFTPEVVNAFTRNLRRLRIIVHPELLNTVPPQGFSELKQLLEQ